MLFVDALFNSLLVVSSGYAMYTLHPLQTPYGYAAAAFSFVHGLVGVVRAAHNDGDGDECNRLRQITTGIMELVPLPLTNIELYLKSSLPHLAMAHGCFLAPLVFDLIAIYRDVEDNSTETLKDLTFLGNVVSMLFLGVNQSKNIYGGMAMIAYGARYAAVLFDYYWEGLGSRINLLADSAFIILMAKTLTAK